MQYLYCSIFLGFIAIANGWTDTKQRSFPGGFLFGAASAAYQVEGGWNEDGKGESIWDRFMHSDPRMSDIPNGDVASDSYHQYKRDVETLRELGVDFYRFSLSWSRLLPNGLINKINEAGVEYYNDLIDELLKYNIEPMVTLYHFDLPQYLQDLGGWANPLAVEWFEDYARLMFQLFGDRVKYWITINQANSICMEGYLGDIAPGIESQGIADYLCLKNVLLAHASVYHVYTNEFKNQYKGQVGITMSINWIDPLNNKTENVEAANKARAFHLGLYLDPIYGKSGDFPRLVKDAVAKKSAEQGFSRSRLPVLSAEEIKLIRGSSDFLGMNHYTTWYAQPAPPDSHPTPSYRDDVGVLFTQGELWTPAKSSWLKSAPYGIYRACIYLNLNYDYPDIIITEHGWSTDPGLRDHTRVDNLRKYLAALLLALEDGTNLKGYTAWSLMDNVEWNLGTGERFGLYQVDFESANKTRTARLSALVYQHIIETRTVDDQWKPDNLRIRISNRRRKTTSKTEL